VTEAERQTLYDASAILKRERREGRKGVEVLTLAWCELLLMALGREDEERNAKPKKPSPYKTLGVF